MLWYLPFAKSETEVTIQPQSLDTVRPPLPLTPPIPLPSTNRLVPHIPLAQDWLERLWDPLIIASMTGFALGFTRGFRRRGWRWTAENSHRKPDTKAGWYTYRKQKNYATLTAGSLGGLRYALRYSAFTATFLLLEAMAEHVLVLNQRWRVSKKVSGGEGAWWGQEFWSWADQQEGGEMEEVNVELRDDLTRAAGGALAGGNMVVLGGLYYRFYPPVIRKLTLLALAGGGAHGFLSSYVGRQEASERAAKRALLGVDSFTLDFIVPTSVDKAREDEELTRRTLEAWSEAAGAEVDVPAKESGDERLSRWRGWVKWPWSGRTREEIS